MPFFKLEKYSDFVFLRRYALSILLIFSVPLPYAAVTDKPEQFRISCFVRPPRLIFGFVVVVFYFMFLSLTAAIHISCCAW